MTSDELTTSRNKLLLIKADIKKMFGESNLNYLNNISELLKTTDIDRFNKTSELINKSHENLTEIYNKALSDIDEEILMLDKKIGG